MKAYRIASWWFRWEDFNYPDKGIEDKLHRRAAAFSEAGVELAFIFGLHCRWDYVYCFDRIHELIKLSCDACHEHGIKVFDHYSATLIHRPRSMEGEWKLYHEGRNRMTFHPSLEMAEQLAWRGSRLNDWRMLRITDNKPLFLNNYQSEMFCMNNPEFRKASADYLIKLRDETGIDGLLFDDGLFYGGWDTCGCPHCRSLFKQRCGLELPKSNDASFWGNYTNPLFREWVRFRYESAVNFLRIPKEALGAEFPLSACCCGSGKKHYDGGAQNICYFTEQIDHVELEMCGEISAGLLGRVTDLFIHRAAAARKNLPCFGIGFAFYPDTAFLVWALNKLFGVGCWVSAGKGRVNVTAAEMQEMPNEEDIIKEGYNYEKEHSDLFEGKPESSVKIFFSSSTKINHGDARADYETAFYNLTESSFAANLPIDVIVSLEDTDNHSLLVLADVACLAGWEREKLWKFLENGGTILASGLLGTHDENGNLQKNHFLEKVGLNYKHSEPIRDIDLESFFTSPWHWLDQPRTIPDSVDVITAVKKDDDFYRFQVGKGQLYWTARRLNTQEAVPGFIKQLKQLTRQPYQVEAPADLAWQAFRNGTETIIHFLNTNFTRTVHPAYTYLNKPIAQSLSYEAQKGELLIRGDFSHAELYSPDVKEVRRVKAEKGVIKFRLEGIHRFCSVKLT